MAGFMACNGWNLGINLKPRKISVESGHVRHQGTYGNCGWGGGGGLTETLKCSGGKGEWFLYMVY